MSIVADLITTRLDLKKIINSYFTFSTPIQYLKRLSTFLNLNCIIQAQYISMELRKRTANDTNGSNNGHRRSSREDDSSKGSFKSQPQKRKQATRRWKMPKKLKLLMQFFVVTFITIAIIVLIVFPTVFKFSPFIRRQILFMNWFNLPMGKNLSNPETEFGLNCTRHMFVESTIGYSRSVGSDSESNQKIKLGLWHILPLSRIHECDMDTPEKLKDPFSDDRPVVLYLHGNGGARGGNHRRGLYKVLTHGLDYHVVTFDYRGYGDSENIVPSLPGMVHDSKTVYEWLLKQVNNDRDRVIVWGHSLGTAIATYVVSSIQEGKSGRRQPPAVVLEAPFNSLQDVITLHPFAMVYKHLPYFESFIVEPLISTPETSIDPSSKVHLIQSPIMILHAEDDAIVPFDLGYKLYQNFEDSREKKSEDGRTKVKFVRFGPDRGYGHKAIFKDSGLPDIIKGFIEESLKLRKQKQETQKPKQEAKMDREVP